jgi:hypothetical protein
MITSRTPSEIVGDFVAGSLGAVPKFALLIEIQNTGVTRTTVNRLLGIRHLGQAGMLCQCLFSKPCLHIRKHVSNDCF